MAGIHNMLAGSGGRLSVTIDITSNQTNYVFNIAKVSGYVAGFTDVIFNIASGVVLSASSTGTYAGNVDTSWAAGDTVRINNNGGFIIGCGGAGGAGGQIGIAGSGGAGGGPAFIAQRPISFNNAGTIGGGGGGGGGAQGGADCISDGKGGSQCFGFQAGGGGGGRSSAAANAPGGAVSGGTGTFSGPGGGGTNGYTGGSGGGWGAPGGTGQAATGNPIPGQGPYGGGPGGNSVVGSSNITWVSSGTRLGAIT